MDYRNLISKYGSSSGQLPESLKTSKKGEAQLTERRRLTAKIKEMDAKCLKNVKITYHK